MSLLHLPQYESGVPDADSSTDIIKILKSPLGPWQNKYKCNKKEITETVECVDLSEQATCLF